MATSNRRTSYGMGKYTPTKSSRSAVVQKTPVNPEDFPNPTIHMSAHPAAEDRTFRGIRTSFSPFEAPDMPASTHRPSLRLSPVSAGEDAAGKTAVHDSPRMKKVLPQSHRETAKLLEFDPSAPVDAFKKRPSSRAAMYESHLSFENGSVAPAVVESARGRKHVASNGDSDVFNTRPQSAHENGNGKTTGRTPQGYLAGRLTPRAKDTKTQTEDSTQVNKLLRHLSNASIQRERKESAQQTVLMASSQRFSCTPRQSTLSLLHHA
eukprot:ANDGO_06349.mRNA.1 hypothetical protein